MLFKGNSGKNSLTWVTFGAWAGLNNIFFIPSKWVIWIHPTFQHVIYPFENSANKTEKFESMNICNDQNVRFQIPTRFLIWSSRRCCLRFKVRCCHFFSAKRFQLNNGQCYQHNSQSYIAKYATFNDFWTELFICEGYKVDIKIEQIWAGTFMWNF